MLEKVKRWIFVIAMLAFIVGVCIWGLSGCEGGKEEQGVTVPAGSGSTKPVNRTMESINYKSGPDNAKVKVVAFYPGGHEDTIAAVKGLEKKFPGKVQIEIVDWRFPEGFKRRQKSGLTCAGVLINGKYVHKVKIGDKEREVLFTRGMGGEWTKEELIAAVKQELAKVEEQKPTPKEKKKEEKPEKQGSKKVGK